MFYNENLPKTLYVENIKLSKLTLTAIVAAIIPSAAFSYTSNNTPSPNSNQKFVTVNIYDGISGAVQLVGNHLGKGYIESIEHSVNSRSDGWSLPVGSNFCIFTHDDFAGTQPQLYYFKVVGNPAKAPANQVDITADAYSGNTIIGGSYPNLRATGQDAVFAYTDVVSRCKSH